MTSQRGYEAPQVDNGTICSCLSSLRPRLESRSRLRPDGIKPKPSDSCDEARKPQAVPSSVENVSVYAKGSSDRPGLSVYTGT